MTKKTINNIRLETEENETGFICFVYQNDEFMFEVEADTEDELRHEIHSSLAELI